MKRIIELTIDDDDDIAKIDEIIADLEYLINVGAVYNDEGLRGALAIVRKYHEIVDIVSLNDEEFKQCGLKELKEILEEIADGNNNQHN